jgi:hypothetical protein
MYRLNYVFILFISYSGTTLSLRYRFKTKILKYTYLTFYMGIKTLSFTLIEEKKSAIFENGVLI